MPKISDEHRAARQAQILDAAWRCFYRQGVQATTMEQIMAESGLSASAMYRYFAGKDDIIVAAISSSLSRLGQLLEPILEAPQQCSVPALVQQVTTAIESFTARPGYNLCRIALHGWSEAQRNERLRGLMRDFYAAFRDRLADRVRSAGSGNDAFWHGPVDEPKANTLQAFDMALYERADQLAAIAAVPGPGLEGELDSLERDLDRRARLLQGLN